MPIEKYEPNKTSGIYYREREIIHVGGGKRESIYKRYLGKTAPGAPSVEATEKAYIAIRGDISALQQDNQQIPDDLTQAFKTAVDERNSARLRRIVAEKGARLTKIEKEFFKKYDFDSFDDLQGKMVEYITTPYSSGDGLQKIKKSLSKEGISVSKNTISQYIKDAGIHERREFFVEREPTKHEKKLMQELKLANEKISALETSTDADDRIADIKSEMGKKINKKDADIAGLVGLLEATDEGKHETRMASLRTVEGKEKERAKYIKKRDERRARYGV